MLTWFQPQHIIHCRSFRFVFDLRDKFSSTWLRSRMAQTSSWLFRSFFLSNRVWTEPLTARGIYNQLEKYLKQDASVVSFCQQVAAQVPSRLSNFYIVRIHQFANNSRTRDAEKKNKRRFKILRILGTFYVFLTKYKNQILFLKNCSRYIVTSWVKAPHSRRCLNIVCRKVTQQYLDKLDQTSKATGRHRSLARLTTSIKLTTDFTSRTILLRNYRAHLLTLF